MGLFSKPVKALVLGGGGARGLCHIGVLEVLEENNLIPDIIVGTSMGAIVGAYYALFGDVKRVREKIEKLVSDKNLKKIEETFKKEEDENAVSKIKDGLKGVRTFLTTSRLGLDKISFFQDDILRDELKREFELMKFEDLKLKFICVTTRLDEAMLVAFTKGNLIDPVTASASIPGIFKPVEIEGGVYVDGGVLSNVAVDIAYLSGASRIVAVSASHFRKKNNFRNGYEMLEYTMFLRAREIERYKENFADFLLEPDIDKFTWFDFSDINEIVEHGKKMAQEKLPELKKAFKGRNNRGSIRKDYFEKLKMRLEFK